MSMRADVFDAGPRPEQRESRRLVIAALLAALFVSAISQTVIATALPRIIGEMGGLNLYSWVLTSSMLAMTAAMPAFVLAVAALAPLKAPVASVTVVVGSLARK